MMVSNPTAPAARNGDRASKRPVRKPARDVPKSARPRSLVFLCDDVYCDKARTQLYRRFTLKGEDGETVDAYEPIVTRWGMPVLEKVYQDNPRDDEKIDNHTYFVISLSSCPLQPAQTFTHYQITHGIWDSGFGGLAIAKTTQQKMYANVILEQRYAFNVPLEMMPDHTGFQRDNRDGLYHYVLRTGEHIHQDGTITNNHPPLARYTFDSESHTKHLNAWVHYEPMLTPISLQRVSELFQWDRDVDSSGNRLLLHLFSYRSLISTLVPIETAIIAAAKDGTIITDGGSAAGKTSAIDHARGIDGATPYRAEQDAAFSGSITGIETRIDPLRDTLVSISDFHFNTENPTEHELQAQAVKFDAFIRSIADNGEVRPRGTKRITAAKGTYIKAGLVFDGETMPQLFLSRLRRAIVLQFERGLIDVERIKTEWWKTQGIHTALGRALIVWILQNVNSNMGEFVNQVMQVEQAYADTLLLALLAARPSFSDAIARSLATNYARLLTPVWMIEQATGTMEDTGKQALQQAVIQSLCTFADMIDNGGVSQISKEWMISALIALFQDGIGHALAMDNSPLPGKECDLLNRLGYKPTMLVDMPWQRNGVHLANRSGDGETLWYIPDVLLDKVKARARRENLAFPYNQKTFPAFLVRLGIAEKAARNNVWRERFNGDLEYRLKISYALLYAEANVEDEQDAPAPVSEQETGKVISMDDYRSPAPDEWKGTIPDHPEWVMCPDGTGYLSGTRKNTTYGERVGVIVNGVEKYWPQSALAPVHGHVEAFADGSTLAHQLF
jgi:hypothetical protein